MSDINASASYKAAFDGKAEKALAQAHDIRKFEIELYWKRATYFWTIIGVAFAGYFALGRDASDRAADQSIVACLGFIFSLGWHFVNRGSAVWQRNWEIHVDLLEDHVVGPLHKSFMKRQPYKLWRFWKPYGFSPTRVNAALSFFVVIAWLLLLIDQVIPSTWRIVPTPVASLGLAVLGGAILLRASLSGGNSTEEKFIRDPRIYPDFYASRRQVRLRFADVREPRLEARGKIHGHRFNPNRFRATTHLCTSVGPS